MNQSGKRRCDVADETPVADAKRPDCGWCKAYHRSGLLVTLPVCGPDAAAMFAAVDAIIAAGFTSNMPGLESGEEKETVAYVVHGEHERDGQGTPFVLLYSTNDAMKWSFLKVYLNKPEDVQAFEYASGMKLASIPLYVGQDKPARGANKQVDKFIVKSKPFDVVFKANQKHDPNTEEGKMKPARLFLRWANQKPDAAPATDEQIADVRKKWKDFFASDPPLDLFNRWISMAGEWAEVPEKMRKSLNDAVVAHAKQAGWGWDDQAQCYYSGKTVGAVSDDLVPF